MIANTKGFTGHAMATGIEEVVAIKALETGYVPPVANFQEVDPELGPLNLSHGGSYPIEYALRLGAGFGSQISMTLLRWVKTKDGVRRQPSALGYAYRIADPTAWNAWLSRMAGSPATELEVVNRTLRVRDQGLSARVAALAGQSRQAVVPTAKLQAPPPPLPAPVVATKPAPTPLRSELPKASVAVPVAAAPPPPQPPQAAAGTPSVKERILALAVEKTGYPADMLDLDLDLEADLGVDTVKQAEIFAAIREMYNIPRDESRKLRDYPTLAHVIRFVYEKRPDLSETVVSPSTAVAKPAPPVEVTAPVAEVAPPTVTTAVPAQPSADSSVKQRILALMVEKTGYPEDMLDLDLDLEADLGVDTVKQAEMFAAIREIYNIPRDENRKLRDYPTLAHVIRFVYEKRPDLPTNATAAPEVIAPPAPTTTAAAPTTPPPPAPDGESVKQRILALMVEKTGYPEDMLDLDLDLEADLGVDTVKQAEMFAAIREIYNIPRDENRKLRDYPTLAHVIRFVYEKRPDLARTDASVPAASATAAPSVTTTTSVAAVLAPSTPPATAPGTDVKQRILALMVEKTGYPEDMLDLDLDLEADLGVDTVKQAEMFAAIREIYNIPRDENRKLRDYPTLAHVIRFVYEKRP